MAFEIPWEAVDLLNFYGIPWPDVDEDAFLEMKQPLRAFGSDLAAVGTAIAEALQELESGNPSRTLQAISTYFDAVRRDFLNPIEDIANDLAGEPCDLAQKAVLALKVSLVGLCLGELDNDALDVASAILTGGADTPAAVAEAAAVEAAVRALLQELESQAEGELLSVATRYIDSWVNSIVQPFISRAVNGLEREVDSYAPAFVLRQSFELDRDAAAGDAGLAQRLHLSPNDLNHCVESIGSSTAHLDQADDKLGATIDQLFAHPAPGALRVKHLSSELRTALQSVVHTIEHDLVAAIRQLVGNVTQHFISLLTDYQRAITELDQQARQIASQEHHAYGLPVSVQSAGGTWLAAAAGITAVTGAINAEEAERVEVEAATSVQDGKQLVIRADHPGQVPAAASVESIGEVNGMAKRSAEPRQAVAAEAASGGGGGVESLNAHHASHGPSVGVASNREVVEGSVNGHRRGEKQGGVEAVAGGAAGSQVSHLHVNHAEGHEHTPGRADASGEGAKRISAENDRGVSAED